MILNRWIKNNEEYGLLKKVFIFALLLSAFSDALVAQDSQFASRGENLIKNSFFEEELSLWNINSGVEWLSTSGFEGSAALVMNAAVIKNNAVNADPEASQCVSIGDVRLYQLSADFLYNEIPKSAYAHRINIVWYQDLYCLQRGQFGGYLQPKLNNEWQYLSNENLKPMLNAKSVKISITQSRKYSIIPLGIFSSILNKVGFNLLPDLAQGTWDNITLNPIRREDNLNEVIISNSDELPMGQNYIKNGHFNENFNGWKMDSKTLWLEGGEGLKGLQSSEGVNSDLNGIIQTVISSKKYSKGSGVGSICINFGEHIKYDLSAKFKQSSASTQSGNVRLRPTWYELNDCNGQHSTSRYHVDSMNVEGWQTIESKGLTPERGSKSVKIELIQVVNGPGRFVGLWDDINFKAVE